MMCYRDRTYCNFSNCKNFDSEKCHRVLSEIDNKRIIEGSWLVCYYVDKPDCFKEK